MPEPTPHTSGNATRDWLGPAACLAVAILALALGWFKLASLDTGYHVAYGRHFLEHRQVVELDPFLYAETAKPFVNANWGSQVVMALMEAAGGSRGLIGLRSMLLVVVFAAAGFAVRRATNSWHWVAWTWLTIALGAYERFSMRPELFSYAILSVLIVLLMRGIRSPRDVVLAGVLQLAWVNLHSYFLVGILVTAAWTAGEFVTRLRAGPVEKPNARMRARLTAYALGLMVAACFVNPAHYRGVLFPIETLSFLAEHDAMGSAAAPSTDASSWSAITEFHSPLNHLGLSMSARTIVAYLVLLGLTAAAAVAALFRLRIGPFLVMLVLVAMSLQMRRNIALFAIGAMPLAAVALATAIRPGRRAWAYKCRAIVSGVVVVASGWWTYSIASGRFYYVEERINREVGAGYNERMVPVAATQWLALQDALQPKLFVDYFASSNTLQWLPARFKLFVDTNTFAYDESTLSIAEDIAQGRRAYRPFFAERDVNVVLLSAQPNTETLISALSGDIDWALVYFDRHHVVFVRRMVSHVPVIAENRLSSDLLNPKRWIDGMSGPVPVRTMELSTSANVPLALGWFAEARELLREAVRLAPDHSRSWNNLGKCHAEIAKEALREGQAVDGLIEQQRAVMCFETAAELSPEDEIFATNLKRARHSLSLFTQR